MAATCDFAKTICTEEVKTNKTKLFFLEIRKLNF